jgi:hypothetical protein
MDFKKEQWCRLLATYGRTHDQLPIWANCYLEVERGAEGVGDLKVLALPAAAWLPIDIPDAHGVVIGDVGDPDAACRHMVYEADGRPREDWPGRLDITACQVAPAAAGHSAHGPDRDAARRQSR